MSPARKRTVRLIVALTAAVVLGSALIYTSFTAANPALTPTELLRQAQPGRSYQLTGTVVHDSVHREGAVLHFSVQDRGRYAGRGAGLHRHRPRPVPRRTRGDRDGREAGSDFIGERDSLITKCPSKYKTAPPSEKQNI